MNSLTRNQLMRVLTKVQNSVEFHAVDIVSFAGLCDQAQLEDYVLEKFAQLSADRKHAVLSFTRDMKAAA